MSPSCLLRFNLHSQQHPLQVIHLPGYTMERFDRLASPLWGSGAKASATSDRCNFLSLHFLRAVGCPRGPWVRRISRGTAVAGCSGGGQGRAERGVGFPDWLQVGVRAWASLGKKLKEIISQISTTVLHNFCYLSLVGSHLLSKTFF